MADRRTGTLSRVRIVTLLLFTAGAWQLTTAQGSKPADSRCEPGTKSTSCKAKSATTGAEAAPPQTSPAAAFPFPMDDSKGAANASDSKPTVAGQGLPAMPTGDVPDPPASSEKPLHLPPAYTGRSSSSGDGVPASPAGSSSSRSSDDDDVAPTTAAPDAPVRSSALKDLGSRGDMSEARIKLEQTRISDDLKVGGFYMKDGNTQGAYLRFKDAVDHAPEDPEARFSLAEAASKLNKRDEAVQNYQQYLQLDAGGDHDKASRKALGRLGIAAR